LTVAGATEINDTLTVDISGSGSNELAITSGAAQVTGSLGVSGNSALAGDLAVGGATALTGAATLASTLAVTGSTSLTTASATTLSATTADIDGGTVDGVVIATGQIGKVVTLVDANDTTRTLATLITTQTGNVEQTTVNVADIATATDIANRADIKGNAIAQFYDALGVTADAADGSDIVAASTVLRAIDATAAKANSETLGALEDEIDTLNADNAGGNSFLTFFRNLFGTTTAAGGGE
jgi:poly(3-hydroxybutyrate) depolymerase